MTLKNFIEYQGPIVDQTLIRLSDGSLIGVNGDVTDQVAEGIFNRQSYIVTQPDGSKVAINPDHIVSGYYTPKDQR